MPKQYSINNAKAAPIIMKATTQAKSTATLTAILIAAAARTQTETNTNKHYVF